MATAAKRENDAQWTLRTLLDEIARFGDHPALLAVAGETATVWTYAELVDRSRRLASGLCRAGLTPGEPVFLMGEASPGWVAVRLALGAAGALAVPCDHLSSAEEVRTLIADSGCRRAFVDAAFVPLLQEVTGGAVELHVMDEEAPAEGPPSWRTLLTQEPEALPPFDDTAPAMLIYTSGTTGAPKSFSLNSANIHANVAGLVAEGLIGPGDNVLLPLPLHHVYPFVVGLLVPLASGAAVVFPEGLTGPQIAQALRRGQASVIVGVPRLYGALVAGLEAQLAARGRLVARLFGALLDLSIWLRRRFGWRVGRRLFGPLLRRVGPRLRILVSGGAALEEKLIWKLEGLGWSVRNGYGLAETASTFTGNLPGRERIGSEGQPFQGGEVRISDPDDEGVGEIQLRGPNVFGGYRNNPEANRAAFTDDGWFRTGDLGCLDDDGFLYFRGRTKELIVLGGGKNVFPEHLERIYGTSPFIEEIAVLEHGGALHALVRPDIEAIRQSGTPRIEDSLRVALSSAAQHLPSYQRLAGYAIVREPLPRTRLGKYRRFLLPQIYERARSGAAPAQPAAPSAADRAFLERPLARQVWKILAARYPKAPLALDASLQLDLGIDSLEWINLSLEFERRLGVHLVEDDLAEVDSLRDLVIMIERAAERPAMPAATPGGTAILDAERRHWIRPGHLGHRLLAAALFGLNWLIMKALFRLRRQGLDLPLPQGRFIIVANHVSDLDPLAMAAALPFATMQRIYWGGDVARLFSGPARRFFCRAVHIFPVDERSPATSLALAQEVLKRGDALIWFPESWRSPNGELQPFLPGIGTLVEESGATVLPAYIDGTFEAMPRWARLPRPHPITVRFGAPISAAELALGEEETAAARITRSLEDAVAELAPGD